MKVEQLSKFMDELQEMRFKIENDDRELAEEMYQLWLKLLDYRSQRGNENDKARN